MSEVRQEIDRLKRTLRISTARVRESERELVRTCQRCDAIEGVAFFGFYVFCLFVIVCGVAA